METGADTISRLRCQLKEAEDERRKAAQYGLKLVENENLLQNRLDELQNEMVALTENFEQEKYTLQREVELKNRMLGSLNHEYETLKQQQNAQLDVQREQLERTHGQEMNELKNKVEKLKSELDETLLSEKQLKHKVDHLKELMASKSEELRLMSERVHDTMSSEVLNLQLELLAVEQAKADLEERLHDLQYSKEQLELGNSNLTHRVARFEEEKEEREKDLVSYCNALEKAREMNRDLQMQLDHALQQALDPSSKGNSLFAEVEDRRADMERCLISTKVKYQLLQKQHTFTREQLQRLKLQMATLLRMKGSQGEHDQLERLQNMLQQKNGEIEELLTKMKQLEKSAGSENSRAIKLSNSSECGGFEDGYYTDLLQMKLENSDKEIENLKSELSLQRMKALFESQRVLEMERKLHANERQLQACQSDNINLRVLLDELKIKYEPEELMRDSVSLRKTPADMLSESANSRMSAFCEMSCMLSQKEEAKLSDAGLKAMLQDVSINTIPSIAIEKGNEQAGRKRVKIMEEQIDRTALNKKDGNDIGASHDTRLISGPEVETEENCAGAAEETSKCEKKDIKKMYPRVYMSTKQNPDTKCAQQ